MNNINNPAFKSHMQDEHGEVRARVDAMEKFIYAEGSVFAELPRNKQVEACKQLGYMKSYMATLDSRIWTHIKEKQCG
jgi:hypothetical protein